MKKNSNIKLKKIINYSEQSIDKKDIKSVEKVLFSRSISQGPATAVFEKKLGSHFGAKYVNCLSSGTAALHLIGKALKWKKGDKGVAFFEYDDSKKTVIPGFNNESAEKR